MTYEELIHEQNRIELEINSLLAQRREIESKIENAHRTQAEKLFDGILDSLRKMATLGYTMTVCTKDAEWGGENWHELGISLRNLSMTTTDQQEAISEIIGELPSSAL